MSHTVKPWSHPECYSGQTWEGYYSAGFGQSRDSDSLERSNFAVAAKRWMSYIAGTCGPNGGKVR
jgi:hypothetical protein